MLIFLAIALGSFIILVSSFIFGHEHDFGHDHDMSAGIETDNEPTVGFFSPKVIFTLTMGFGAAGAISRLYGCSYLVSSLIGVLSGFGIAGLMYFALSVIYKQQVSAAISTSSAINQTGTVTISIESNMIGQIGIKICGQYVTYSAKSIDGKAISKDKTIQVVEIAGNLLVVKEV
jgi:membrane-bound ClpP family serine protease